MPHRSQVCYKFRSFSRLYQRGCNRISILKSKKSQINYTLDAAGNRTSDGLRQFQINAAGRIASVAQGWGDDQRKTSYLYNALGQRIFKSEPTGQDNPPREDQLGSDFVAWLKNNFNDLFSTNSKTSQLGQAFVYDEQGSLLSESGNGGSQGPGSAQIIWLPTQAGDQIPVGLYKNNRLYAIHADHLGTPRLITDDTNQPVWQWPYSAWGTSPPTGVLKATGGGSSTAQKLERTEPGITVNLRFPGQYADSETGVFYNYFRSYQPNQGRYTQADPIGLEGGWNRFAYVGGNPLSKVDPTGELPILIPIVAGGAVTAYGTYSLLSKQAACERACDLTHGDEVKSCGDPDRQDILDARKNQRVLACKASCAFGSAMGRLLPGKLK